MKSIEHESNNELPIDAITRSFQVTINLLNDYKWLYDFQMTDVFSSNIFESSFPSEVSLKKNNLI